MATAAGDRATRRRAGRRQRSVAAPADIGGDLRAAREAVGITLDEVYDRTGVPRSQLEALEVGELSRFPDRRSLLVAVRRYADLVHLDAEPLSSAAELRWAADVLPAGTAGGAGASTTYGRAPAAHLSQYPGDGTHLRAFTQTAEVPMVGGWRSHPANGHGAHPYFADTGSIPVIARPVRVRPAPYGLRMTVWVTAALLLVGVAGVGVHHWRPQWLATLHLVHHTHTPKPGTPFTPPRPHTATVSTTSSGPGAAAFAVRASQYSVVVAAWQPCWVRVDTPQSFAAVFAQTLQTGQVKTFESANGQMTVSLGASFVTIEVEIGGKAVPGWVFKPPSAPFVINFSSTGS